MYIFGGKQSIFENSQKLFRFDFQEKNWELLVYNENNVTLPSLDSHSVVVNDSEMIVFGGFKGGKIGKYSRSIYSYTFKTNEWRILYDNLDRNVSKNMIPKKRSSAGMVLNNSCLYVFGGVNNKFKFDDFWKFDLTDNNWKCLNPIGGNPLVSY